MRARIRRCVHLDKLAALNLMSFISSNDDPRAYVSRKMFYTCAKPYPTCLSNDVSPRLVPGPASLPGIFFIQISTVFTFSATLRARRCKIIFLFKKEKKKKLNYTVRNDERRILTEFSWFAELGDIVANYVSGNVSMPV